MRHDLVVAWPPARGRVALDGTALSVLLLLAGLAVQPRPAAAEQAVQTFGPGQVNCEALTGTRVDCLLAATRCFADAGWQSLGVTRLRLRSCRV